MEEVADAFRQQVAVTFLFLREFFLLFQSYPAWGRLDIRRGKSVIPILRPWVNVKMRRVCTTPGTRAEGLILFCISASR